MPPIADKSFLAFEAVCRVWGLPEAAQITARS